MHTQCILALCSSPLADQALMALRIGGWVKFHRGAHSFFIGIIALAIFICVAPRLGYLITRIRRTDPEYKINFISKVHRSVTKHPPDAKRTLHRFWASSNTCSAQSGRSAQPPSSRIEWRFFNIASNILQYWSRDCRC